MIFFLTLCTPANAIIAHPLTLIVSFGPVLTLFFPAVGGIFEQVGDGWEECQKPGADPVSLKISIRCLAPPPAIIIKWKGETYDRWAARFCKHFCSDL